MQNQLLQTQYNIFHVYQPHILGLLGNRARSILNAQLKSKVKIVPARFEDFIYLVGKENLFKALGNKYSIREFKRAYEFFIALQTGMIGNYHHRELVKGFNLGLYEEILKYYCAVTATHLTSAGSAADATSYDTASISPTASRLILAYFEWDGQSSPGTASASGNGLTWVAVNNVVTATVFRGYLFRALGTPSAGAITFSIAGGTGTPGRASWTVIELANVDQTGTNGSGALVQSATNNSSSASSLTATLGAFGSVDNATVGFFGMTGTLSVNLSPGAGFTEVGEGGGGVDGMTAQSIFKDTNDTSVDSSSNETDRYLGIAAEIKFALAVAGGLFLAM